jgi:hypothetical protein
VLVHAASLPDELHEDPLREVIVVGRMAARDLDEADAEKLKEKGMSKERAAKIANSPGASSRGGGKGTTRKS